MFSDSLPLTENFYKFQFWMFLNAKNPLQKKKKHPGQEQEKEFEPKHQNLPSKAILWASCFFWIVIIFFLTRYFQLLQILDLSDELSYPPRLPSEQRVRRPNPSLTDIDPDTSWSNTSWNKRE